MSQTYKKITIKQIKKMINDNVKNIWGSEKLSGTNVWFIYMKNTEDVNPALEVLESIGFEVSKATRTRLNYEGEGYNKTIMVSFKGVDETFYARQMKSFA